MGPPGHNDNIKVGPPGQDVSSLSLLICHPFSSFRVYLVKRYVIRNEIKSLDLDKSGSKKETNQRLIYTYLFYYALYTFI